MSQRGMVQKTAKRRTELKPPKGSVQAGFTHDGHQLWRQPRKMNRPVPNIEAKVSEKCGTDKRGEATHTWVNDHVDHPVCAVCGTMGKRLYTTHAQTGENIVARRKPHVVDEERVFWLEDGLNCNVEIRDYVRPSDDELGAAERKKRIKAMDGVLAQVLVDGGLDADEVMARLKGTPETVVTGEVMDAVTIEDVSPTTTTAADVPVTLTEITVPVAPAVEYPVKDDTSPWWTLSDGSRLRGEKAAKAAEVALVAQRAQVKDDVAESAEASY